MVNRIPGQSIEDSRLSETLSGMPWSLNYDVFYLRDLTTIKSRLENMFDSVVNIFVPLWGNFFLVKDWMNIPVQHALSGSLNTE